MNWLAIVNEIFDILWLLSLLAVLIAIWRTSERRARYTETMMTAVIDIGAKDAESARQSSETARTLAAIIQNEQAK